MAGKRKKLSKQARAFIRKHVRALMAEGYGQKQAVGKAYGLARREGYKVPVHPNPEETKSFTKKRKAKAGAKPGKGKAKPKKDKARKKSGKAKKKNPEATKKARGREAVGGHPAMRPYCKKCGGVHTAHAHDAHGPGSHKRTHGGGGAGVKKKRAPVAPAAPATPRQGQMPLFANPGPLLAEMVALNPGGGPQSVLYTDLPKKLKAKARPIAEKAARLNGIPISQVEFVRYRAPDWAPPVVIEVGEMNAIEYRPPKGSRRARGVYRHKAGDLGGGKKARPLVVAVDMDGNPVLLPQKGSKPGLVPHPKGGLRG